MAYGPAGELVAEYANNGATLAKEYGYRGGELLMTATTSGDVRWLVTDQPGIPRIVAERTGSLAADAFKGTELRVDMWR